MISIKKTVAALILCGACAVSLCAMTGVGAQGSLTWNTEGHPYWSTGLSLRPVNLPFSFTLEADFDRDHEGVYGAGVSGYWWMMNPRLAGTLHYYVGPGVTASVYPKTGESDAFGCFVGTGLLAGLDIFLWDPVEFYARLTTDVGALRFDGAWTFSVHMPLSMGLRFWF